MHAGLPKVSWGDLVSGLKSLETFTAAFFSLFEKESETLGSELVGWEAYDLWPGERQPYRGQLRPGTEFVAPRAVSRDPWRQMAPVSAKREGTVPGGIDVQAVTMAAR